MASSRFTASSLEVIHTPPSQTSLYPPLLFIHGAYCAASCWQVHLMPWLASKGFDCYAVSLPGHGNSVSDTSLPMLSMSDYLAAVTEVIATMPASPILVGHSLGGAVVQQYLEQHEATGAILLASVPPSGLMASSVRLASSQPEVLWQLSKVVWGHISESDLYKVRDALFTPHLSQQTLLDYMPLFQAESMRALWDLTLQGWLPAPPLQHVPALVAGAEKDALFTEEEITETAKRFGVNPVILPDMGHAMMLEHNWQLLAELMQDWITRRYPAKAPVAADQATPV